MGNYADKKKRAYNFNEALEEGRVNRLNNDFARDTYHKSVSYFVRWTMQSSKPEQERANMRDIERFIDIPDDLTEEVVIDCIDWLNQNVNRESRTLNWSEALKELSEAKKLSHYQSSYIFVRWTQYLDAHNQLAKVIDFTK